MEKTLMKRVAVTFPSLLPSCIPTLSLLLGALGQLNQQPNHHAIFMAQGSHKYSSACLQRFSNIHTLQQRNFLAQDTGSKQREETGVVTS